MTLNLALNLVGCGTDLVVRDVLFPPGEVVVFGEEEHTMALFTLSHGDAGAVPVGGFDFGLFVLVVTTGT